MAEEKKADKKPEGWNFDPVEVIILLILAVGILGTLLPLLFNYIFSGQVTFYGIKLSSILEFLKDLAPLFKALGLTLAGAAAIGAFILTKRADMVLKEEKSKVYPENMVLSSVAEPPKNPMVERWEKIVKGSESVNPSDWRLAIIEADIILGDLLDNLRLPGETIGDKLKAVEPSDFNTIEAAWEAHKARNMIAHQGNEYLINQREIRRIISLYESVFKEFCLI